MEPIIDDTPLEQDPEMGITELPDGSVMVEMSEEVSVETGFDDNLVPTLDKFTLNSLASTLVELIDQDKEARKKRDEQYAEGLRRTGLGDDAPGGALFEGASRVVHPVLAEGCVDYAARAIREIFPANGPVKTKIVGVVDSKKLDLARRKSDYLNWQLTHQIQEYRPEKEVLLTQLPLGGSQYEKYWYDPSLGRTRMEFVPIDKVLLPFSATSFYTAQRITHIQEITEEEFENRIESGLYAGEVTLPPGIIPEGTDAQTSNNKIEGKSSSENTDGLRTVYEMSVTLDIEDNRAPYIVHIDGEDDRILGVYRNWAEDDEKKIKLDWWVEDKFIPWRGAYGIGLPHLIGGMAAALTGALRALLDSAHINNSPGAVKLKGGRTSGANTQIAQTEVKEIDAPAGVDDIRKVMMPMPFNPPSPVLFQLLDWVTAQAKGVVATTEEKMDQIGDRTPVGTTMAMIEQGSATYSAIHARLHESQRRALQIICRLNATYPDHESLERYGLTPEDFLDTSDIDPVSDPHIFSEAQRYAQLQEQVKLLQVFPQLPWNANELARRAMQLLRVDGIDAILPKQPDPVTADPVTENVAAMSGAPLKAAPQQDHVAHIMTHVGFIVNPTHQMVPGPMPQLAGIMKHVEEHLTQFYHVTVQASAATVVQQAAAQGEQLATDQIAMRAAQQAQQLMANLLKDAAPMMQAAGQVLQSKMPQPPVDPAVQKTFEAAMAQIQSKEKIDAERLKMDGAKMQGEAAFARMQEQNAMQLAAMQEENKKQIAVITEMGKKQAEELRQQVEMMKNDRNNEQHQITELLKNRDDNQTAVIIEQMKQAIAASQPQQVEQPRQDDSMLKEMQRMLGEIEKAKTGDALTATVDALRQMMEGQRDHQTRTMMMAQELLK